MFGGLYYYYYFLISFHVPVLLPSILGDLTSVVEVEDITSLLQPYLVYSVPFFLWDDDIHLLDLATEITQK